MSKWALAMLFLCCIGAIFLNGHPMDAGTGYSMMVAWMIFWRECSKEKK